MIDSLTKSSRKCWIILISVTGCKWMILNYVALQFIIATPTLSKVNITNCMPCEYKFHLLVTSFVEEVKPEDYPATMRLADEYRLRLTLDGSDYIGTEACSLDFPHRKSINWLAALWLTSNSWPNSRPTITWAERHTDKKQKQKTTALNLFGFTRLDIPDIFQYKKSRFQVPCREIVWDEETLI